MSTPISVRDMIWPHEVRAFAVEAYFSCGHSISTVQREVRRYFKIPPDGRVPERTSIVTWVEVFRQTGSVSKPRTGHAKTVTTPENVERVRLSLLKYPKHSLRKHAAAVGISVRSLHRIVRRELTLDQPHYKYFNAHYFKYK